MEVICALFNACSCCGSRLTGSPLSWLISYCASSHLYLIHMQALFCSLYFDEIHCMFCYLYQYLFVNSEKFVFYNSVVMRLVSIWTRFALQALHNM